MRIVDLRSDTLTLPTEEMLEAIKNARLGDDVFGEDATVNKLQELASEKMGKEAALLVTSGTQGNLVSIMSQTTRGEEVILEEESHVYVNEVGGISAMAGLLVKPLKGAMGALDPTDVEASIRPRDIHQPKTALVCIENTHNRAGGTCIAPIQVEKLSEVCRANGLFLHMDGARVFNAAVALGVDVKQIARHVDSVTFCLSKGLSCPVGSVVMGGCEFIEKARRVRKMLGGGMRQAGIIAAPGIIALEKMVDRLKEDHDNARALAAGLAKIEGIFVDLSRVQTNIVLVDVKGLGMDSHAFASRLREKGVKVLPSKRTLVRMMTYRGIERDDILYTLEKVGEVAEAGI